MLPADQEPSVGSTIHHDGSVIAQAADVAVVSVFTDLDSLDRPRLRWQDVDLEAGTLAVIQTIQSMGGKLLVSEPKTAAGRRPIAIDKSTVAALRDHRKRMLEERMLVGADFSDEGLVFHRPDGSALRPETVSASFLRRQRDLGLPRLTIKGLRHTWATLALKQGIHPKVVQERLGHSTVGITLNIYSHTNPTLHAEAAEQISDLILGPLR